MEMEQLRMKSQTTLMNHRRERHRHASRILVKSECQFYSAKKGVLRMSCDDLKQNIPKNSFLKVNIKVRVHHKLFIAKCHNIQLCSLKANKNLKFWNVNLKFNN